MVVYHTGFILFIIHADLEKYLDFAGMAKAYAVDMRIVKSYKYKLLII
jgi:hypothetical protein